MENSSLITLCPPNKMQSNGTAKKLTFSILWLLFVFLFPFTAFSQKVHIQQIDQFEKISAKAFLSSEEIANLITLCSKMMEQDSYLSLKYMEKVRVLIDKNKSIESLPYYAGVLARNYQYKEDPLTGLNIIQELYRKYETDLTPLQQTHFLVAILIIMDGMQEYEECLPLIKKVLLILEKEEHGKKDEYLATIYNIRGSCSVQLRGDHEAATADFLRALRLYKKRKHSNDINNVGIIYNRLGLMYQDLKDYPKSISYFLQGIKELESVGASLNTAILYSNLGLVYVETSKLQTALDYQIKALKITQKNDQQVEITRIHANMGNIYLKMKNYPKALEYTKLSLNGCRQFNIPEGIMHNYIVLGNIYAGTNQHKSAETAYDSAMVYVKGLVMPRVEASLYEHYSDLYKKTGNFKKALEFQTKYYDLEKEFFGQEKQKAIAQLEIEYHTEIKDQQIRNAAVEIKTKKAQNRILVIAIIAVILVMGFVVFFLIYRNRILKDLYARNVELMKTFSQSTISEPKDIATTDTGDETEESHNLKAVFDRLQVSLKDEKIYTDPDLSLSKICELIKSNEKYVSSAIASYAKTNYSNFINFYRINEAKRLIYETNSLNLNEVMYASGFNSRTTFYTAFKKHTGMSPKQFKEMS